MPLEQVLTGRCGEGRWDGCGDTSLPPVPNLLSHRRPAAAKLPKAGVFTAADTTAAPHAQPGPWFLGSWCQLHHFAVISHLPWDGVQLFAFSRTEHDAPTHVPLTCYRPQCGHRRCDSPSANPALETQILEPAQTRCHFLKDFPAAGSISLKTCWHQTPSLQPLLLMGTPEKSFLGGDGDGVHRRACSHPEQLPVLIQLIINTAHLPQMNRGLYTYCRARKTFTNAPTEDKWDE